MDKQKDVDQNADKLRILVNKLLPYNSRKHKLDGNFSLAVNAKKAMIEQMNKEWLPRQPDKKEILALSSHLIAVGADFVDFLGFIFHGNKYWEKLEQGKNAHPAP